MLSLLELARRKLHAELGARGVLTFSRRAVGKGDLKRTVSAASNADFGNRASLEISNGVVEEITGETRNRKKLAGQTLGDVFEELVAGFLRSTFLSLGHLRPGRWSIDHVKARANAVVPAHEQYRHLGDLARFCLEHRQLAAALGNDYAISPDVIVSRRPEPDEEINRLGMFLDDALVSRAALREKANPHPILHACVSCKFTLRSDRSQNARSEALNLIRNRKGRVPHIVIVTAECLPSRLASLALGTGDIDCLYHIALPELVRVIENLDFADAQEMLETMIEGRRIRDISDLPLDLAV